MAGWRRVVGGVECVRREALSFFFCVFLLLVHVPFAGVVIAIVVFEVVIVKGIVVVIDFGGRYMVVWFSEC